MANSKRRCKYCSEYVREWIRYPAGVFCCADHAIKFATQNRKQPSRSRNNAPRTLSDRSRATQSAQRAFNAYIRARDQGKPCISCGALTELEAGHYLSIGARPELRFNENNVQGQCNHCNVTLSGNQKNYRIGLIGRIGYKAVLELERNHEPKHYTVEDLKEVAIKYKIYFTNLQKYCNM